MVRTIAVFLISIMLLILFAGCLAEGLTGVQTDGTTSSAFVQQTKDAVSKNKNTDDGQSGVKTENATPSLPAQQTEVSVSKVENTGDGQADVKTENATPPLSATQAEKPTYHDEATMEQECKLIINEREVFHGNQAKIDYQNGYAALPITMILSELGAEIQWQDVSIVMVKYKEMSFLFDLQEENFGLPIPPGVNYAIRELQDNEVIVDSTSVRWMFRNVMNAEIKIDYEASTILVEQKAE